MNTIKYGITIFIALVTLSVAVCSQTGPATAHPVPQAGKVMPDFTLDRITHYKKTKASLKDFKGKWLFLDFWFTGCISCIKSFPKINALQQQFKDDIQFMLVGCSGVNASGKGIEQLYEKLRVKQNLQIAVAYDSVLDERWGIHSMPHIIIIDPDGMVRAVTAGQDMTAGRIQDLLDGKPVTFYPKDDDMTEFVEKPDDISGNIPANDKPIYRSVFTQWKGEKWIGNTVNYFAQRPDLFEKGWRIVMAPLEELYKQAYVGQTFWSVGSYYYRELDSLFYTLYPDLVLEIRDSSWFKHNFRDINTKGLYNWTMVLPASKYNRKDLMLTMQRELKNIFGYEVVVEKRNMQVWNLVALPGAENKLKTKGGEPYMPNQSIAAGITVKNVPVEKFLRRMIMYITDNRPPFYDETGIKYNIDITMDADMTAIEDVRRELQKNGLDLVMRPRKMDVIVIRDPETVQQGFTFF